MCAEDRLPRYWFHAVCEDRTYRDEVGRDFGSPEEAFAHAETIAKELAADGGAYRGYAVRVLDEQGREVAFLPVGPALP